MNDSNFVMVEINGVKMEVDTPQARKIEHLRVGSRVKVLTKDYSGEYKVSPGVVVGFDAFQNLPTISVCYLEIGYPGSDLKFIGYNAASKGIEIVAATDDDHLEVSKFDVLARLDRETEKKRLEIDELEQRRVFFLSHFAEYFQPAKEA